MFLGFVVFIPHLCNSYKQLTATNLGHFINAIGFDLIEATSYLLNSYSNFWDGSKFLTKNLKVLH